MDLEFDVQFYDEHHQALLLAGRVAPALRALASQGLVLAEEELLVQSMFTVQRDLDGWRTYADFRERAAHREEIFRENFATNHGKIVANFEAAETESSEIERLGAGVGIATMNRVLGVTEADWWRIWS